MFTAQKKTITMVAFLSLLHVACAPNKNEAPAKSRGFKLGVINKNIFSLIGKIYIYHKDKVITMKRKIFFYYPKEYVLYQDETIDFGFIFIGFRIPIVNMDEEKHLMTLNIPIFD